MNSPFKLNVDLGRRLKPVFEARAGVYPVSIAGASGGDGPLSSPLEITIVVVLVKAVLDAAFETAAALLTNMERHPSHSACRCSDLTQEKELMGVSRPCNRHVV